VNKKPVVISDLRVGSNVAVTYATEGNRSIAGTVTLAEPKSDTEPAPRAAKEVRGKVVKVGNDDVVIETPEKKKVSLALTSKTRFTRNEKDVLVADIRVGSNVTAVYAQDGEKSVADSIILVDNLPAAPPPRPGTGTPIPPPAANSQAAAGNMVEGEIVRVVGNDQVVVRTVDGQEMPVFVDPQTAFLFDAKAATFAALKAGMPIAVEFTAGGQRRVARKITGITALEGQIVRVVGKDQVVLKTATGAEQTVFVSPQTRFMLNAQGGAFTDLRAGMNVNVFSDVRNRQTFARNIFVRPRR
jgi:uncharacterized membrane protein